MTPSRRAPAAAALLGASLLALATAGPAAAERPRLVLTAGSPVFEGGELELAVEMRGALEDRFVTFTVTVDGEAVHKFDARGPSARHRFSDPSLTAGVHEIGIRTGSEKARIEVRVLPRWTLPAAGGTLVALATLTLFALRRRRRVDSGSR